MSSDQGFVDFIMEQMADAGTITCRKMFGEYAVYSNGKVVALVCDNRLFVKASEGGRSFIGNVTEAPAYPGAKMSFLVGDKVDDREWLGRLIRITESELPEPHPRKRKSRKPKVR